LNYPQSYYERSRLPLRALDHSFAERRGLHAARFAISPDAKNGKGNFD
jgi:hypothetical protein